MHPLQHYESCKLRHRKARTLAEQELKTAHQWVVASICLIRGRRLDLKTLTTGIRQLGDRQTPFLSDQPYQLDSLRKHMALCPTHSLKWEPPAALPGGAGRLIPFTIERTISLLFSSGKILKEKSSSQGLQRETIIMQAVNTE